MSPDIPIMVNMMLQLVFLLGYAVQVKAQLSQIPNPFSTIEASDTLKWTRCYEDSPAASLGAVECARLNVSHRFKKRYGSGS